MLKKKYNLQKQIILKQKFLNIHLLKLVRSSLSPNHNIEPLMRISFFVQYSSELSLFDFFFTYQKLLCLTTLSSKVHNKKYMCSRYFLNKQLNTLVYANTMK